MDFGKFKYETAQKAKEARRNQANTILKEVRFPPEDRQTRLRDEAQARRGLPAGRRQGQSHDPVPRPRAVPPRAGLPPAPEVCRRCGGVRLGRVHTDHRRTQHGHGHRPAEEQGGGEGRGPGTTGGEPAGPNRSGTRSRPGSEGRGPARPKVEAPVADAPKAETPKAEAPVAAAPKAEAPKAEAPAAAAPKAEAPKAEAPKAAAPKAPVPAKPATPTAPRAAATPKTATPRDHSSRERSCSNEGRNECLSRRPTQGPRSASR